MATRPYLMHEQPGNPFALTRAPDPALLEQAGAKKMANALRQALALRADCNAAKAEMLAAEQDVKVAGVKDREDLARALTKSRNAPIKSTHMDAAKRKVEDLRRRHEALVTAVESATRSYYEAGQEEAETAADAARKQREHSAADLRRAHQIVVAALDSYEDLACAANATGDPDDEAPATSAALGGDQQARDQD